MKPNSAEEFLKNKLPKPLDEFTMFSGRLAKVLMEEFASLREKETAIEFLEWFNKQHHPEDRIIEWHEWYTEYTKHKEG